MFVIKLTGKILGRSLWAAQPASHPSSRPIFPCCLPRVGSRSPGALQGLWAGVAGLVGISQPTLGSLEHVYPHAEAAEDGGKITGWKDALKKMIFVSLLCSCSGHSCSLEPEAVRLKFFQYLETSL